MSHPTQGPCNTWFYATGSEQGRPTTTPASASGQDEVTKPTSRLRSACDSCRRAKTKCLGGNPCYNCQLSQVRCDYSHGGRLGRPKGSKNRRTLMQQLESGNDQEQRSEIQHGRGDSTNRTTAELPQRRDSGPREQQQQPERDQQQAQRQKQQSTPPSPSVNSITFDLGLDHLFDANGGFEWSAGEWNKNVTDVRGHTDLMLGQSFISHNSGISTLEDILRSEPDRSGTMTQTHLQGERSSNLSSNSLISPLSAEFSGFVDPMSRPGSRSSITTGCSCLQLLARLLYDLEHLHLGSSVDSVLRGVQLAETPWNNLIRCSAPPTNHNHKEAFLLFAMSVRSLLSSVQKLSNQSLQANKAEAPYSFPDTAVSVGGFELKGEAKAEVIDVLIRRTQQSITMALINLSNNTRNPVVITPPSETAMEGGYNWQSTSSPKRSTQPQQWSLDRPASGTVAKAGTVNNTISSALDKLMQMLEAVNGDTYE